MAHTERVSALLALRARALAKFGEVDTVPVSENNPFKIEKKYKNIRKKRIQKIKKKKKYKRKARTRARTRNKQGLSARPTPLS